VRSFEPFLPFSAAKLRTMLGMTDFEWDSLGRIDLLAEGHKLGESVLLFEKIEDDVIQAQLDRLARIKEENDKLALKEAEKNWRPAPIADEVSFDQFAKLDLRTATVLDVKPVKKSDKLLQFTLDDGTDQPRTILSGIAQSYPDPQVLVGKQVVFVANFAPKIMRGIASNGMILSAENFDGSLHVVTLEDKVKNGSKVC
jgi:methionyl-tRNA synthetase